jgi:predicted ABC-type sugar transport system permease subunit
MRWGVVGAAGKASTQLATMPFDGYVFYIESWVQDANDTFSETDLTVIAGSTTVDVVVHTADTLYVIKDQDDLSSTAIIAGGTALNLTVENVSVDADTQVIVTLWVYPANW